MIRITLYGLFFLPYVVLLLHVHQDYTVSVTEFSRVLGQSTWQALLSSVFSVSLGVVGAMGLLSLRSRMQRRFFEMLFMTPNFLPALFVITSTIHLVTLVTTFPFGVGGVVLVHVAMSAGLMAVFISNLIESRAGGIIELATIEGASRFATRLQVILSIKNEILSMSYAVFVMAFSSFSVPLIVGLNQGETMEVLIYRSLLGRGDLNTAVIYAVIQLVILAVLAKFISSSYVATNSDSRTVIRIGSRLGLAFLSIMTFLLIASNVPDLIKGVAEILNQSVLLERIVDGVIGSLLQSFTVGFLLILFFILVAFSCPDRQLEKFLFSYAAPSSVVIGLAFYILFDVSSMSFPSIVTIISFAFMMSIVTILYRLKFHNIMSSLMSQLHVAKIIGASRIEIFRKITWPQISREVFSLAGWGAFWASGDFALSSMISGREMTLAMGAQTFLGGYRLHLATAFTVLSLVAGILIYFIFEGMGHVYHKKSHT